MDIKIFKNPAGIRRALLSFSGWPDAGKVVQMTLVELKRAFSSELAAAWDVDGYWHADSQRPTVTVRHGQMQRLDWPAYLFHRCSPPSVPPILVGTGPEPSFHWRMFTAELMDLLQKWECREIILLGSVYDQIFHDEILISGVVQDSADLNLMLDLGCQQVEYSGPGAIHSAIMEMALQRGMRCIGLWAHFPSYLSAPHELLMAHLLQMLGVLFSFEVDTSHLMENWQLREKEIRTLIQEDDELRQALDSLKKQTRERIPQQHRSSKVIRLDDFKRRHEHPGEEE